MTTNASSKWRNVEPAHLVLALLPWFLLAVDSSWIYNATTGIDQWIYFGYFLDYPRYVTHLYPEVYYGSRLSWILPGYVLHRLFDPVTARYILHVGFYYLAVFSLYSLLRKAVGQRMALLAAVLFGTHSYFLGAIGWDYVDGPGLTYNVVALACIAQAATSSRYWVWLIASGAAAAGMFYCNAFLVVFLPFLPAFYLYQTHQGLSAESLRAAVRFVIWFIAGALLVTVILGAVNYAVGAGFWFYAPTFAFIAKSSSKPNQWFHPGWSWAGKASWLALPLMVALGSVSYLLLHLRPRELARRDLRLFFVLHYLGCLGIMTAWHFTGGLGLEGFFYTSYLLPSAFLALGSIFMINLESWPRFAYWTLLAVVTLAIVLSLVMISTTLAGHVRLLGWLVVSLTVGMFLALNVFLGGRWQMLLVILAALCLYQTGFELAFVTRNENSKEILLRMLDSLRVIRKHTADDPLWFWYNSKGRFGNEFNSINSAYLWSWAIVSPDFPGTWPQHPMKLGTAGVILSSDDDVLEQADRALRPIRLKARLLETNKIERDGISYRMFFFRAEPLGTREQAVAIELAAAPGPPKMFRLAPAASEVALQREQWAYVNYPEGDGRFELRPDGAHITTHREAFSYAVKYPPLMAGRSGLYRFVLEYADLHGGLQFGCLSADEKNWVAQAPPAKGDGIKGIREAYMLLNAGERVIPLVANYRYPEPGGRSSFVLKSFRAYAEFDK